MGDGRFRRGMRGKAWCGEDEDRRGDVGVRGMGKKGEGGIEGRRCTIRREKDRSPIPEKP